MIAKISSSANLAGALGYNFKKVNTGGASVLLAEGLYENPDSAYTLLEVLSDMLAFIPPKMSHEEPRLSLLTQSPSQREAHR